MTLTGKPCTCGGSNANCYRCFGTGVLQTQTPAHVGSRGMLKTTSTLRQRSKRRRRTPSSASAAHLSKCRFCGAVRAQSAMAKHHSVCPRRPATWSWRTSRRHREFDIIADIRNRDVIDASKDYYAFRENGRFGSFPAYDSYDDESQP